MDSYFTSTISFPPDITQEKKYPVIFVMHGRGSNEKDIMNMLEALKNDAILVGIRGTLHLYQGFEYFTIKSFGNPDVDSFNIAISNLEHFIEDFKNYESVDSSKQFLFGFSQGAILSMTLALTMGSKIKGIAALSGYIPRHVKENKQLKSVENSSILIGHGETDRIFPISIGYDNFEFFKDRTKYLDYKSYPIGHEISQQEKEDVITWFKQQIRVDNVE